MTCFNLDSSSNRCRPDRRLIPDKCLVTGQSGFDACFLQRGKIKLDLDLVPLLQLLDKFAERRVVACDLGGRLQGGFDLRYGGESWVR